MNWEGLTILMLGIFIGFSVGLAVGNIISTVKGNENERKEEKNQR